jgi:hypothetical protein
MGRSLEAQSDERSLNLDAIRASLEEAAAVLAEMADGDATATPTPASHESGCSSERLSRGRSRS